VASFPIPHEGKALAISEGVDRDRAVDEAGNQIGVFGRVGARPLNREEQQRLYLRGGAVWKVVDDPRGYPAPRPYRRDPALVPARAERGE
jgi:hypothetical protein